MKQKYSIFAMMFFMLCGTIGAQTFQDYLEGEQNGEFPSKWNSVVGSAMIANGDDGQKIIKLSNNTIIKPIVDGQTNNYLDDSFTLKFSAYFDDIEKSITYQYYLIRFWDGDNNETVQTDTGRIITFPLKIFRHGASIEQTIYSPQVSKERYNEFKQSLQDTGGVWRSIVINYSRHSFKVSIDDIDILIINNPKFSPKMLSIGGYYLQFGQDYLRAINHINISGIKIESTDSDTTDTDTDANSGTDTNTDTTNAFSGLEALDEGNGIGWRLKGRDPNLYGDIGNNAVDLSFSNKPSFTHGATGGFSTAMGYNTIASLGSSTAMGQETTASGFASTSMGEKSIAAGGVSLAMGYSAIASGNYATAIGYSSVASGDYAMAIGNTTSATGSSSLAMGQNTQALQNYATALGSGTIASGEYSTSFGYNTKASNAFATSMGLNTEASGHASMALGNGSKAIGENSVAFGNNTSASGLVSTAMGSGTSATGDYATALGQNTQALQNYATAMGSGTIASEEGSTAMGNNTEASGKFSTAMGSETKATGIYSTAMGSGSKATGQFSFAIGGTCIAQGVHTTAIGYKTYAIGNYSTSIGYATVAEGLMSMAFGENTKASGENSTTMGKNTEASGKASTAMGNLTIAAGENSTALGLGTFTSSSNSLVIGQYNTDDVFIYDELIFQVGMGTSDSNRKDAFWIAKNGAAHLYGDLNLSGRLSQNSDKRLKQDIANLSYGINEIMQLRPVSYHWKSNPDVTKKTIGLIAQEVQPIINEIVQIGYDKDKTLSLSYTELIPILIKAIQDQQGIINKQDEKIETLTSSIASKDEALNALVQRIEHIESTLKNDKL